MPVTLELGGKSPNIVFADADLDSCGRGCGWRHFRRQRPIVHRRFAAVRAAQSSTTEVVVALSATAQRAAHRPARRARRADGPARIVRAPRARRAAWSTQRAPRAPTCLCGGARPRCRRAAHGAFYLPTLIGGIDHRAAIAQQEIFGPVLCVLPFDDEDDLIARPTTPSTGWLRDLDGGLSPRVARGRRLEAGTVWINTYKQLSIATPFGGFKDERHRARKRHRRSAPVSADQGYLSRARSMSIGRTLRHRRVHRLRGPGRDGRADMSQPGAERRPAGARVRPAARCDAAPGCARRERLQDPNRGGARRRRGVPVAAIGRRGARGRDRSRRPAGLHARGPGGGRSRHLAGGHHAHAGSRLCAARRGVCRCAGGPHARGR